MCDFAQYYHILDMDALPMRIKATLAAGLPEESRSKLKASGSEAPVETMLLAIIADSLRLLVWQNTEDGHRGRNQPEKLSAALLPTGKEEKETQGFSSAEDFERARERLLRGGV